MLPNLGYAFYDMAVSVQAFLTDATNLNKIQMQTRICPKMHDFKTITWIFVIPDELILISIWKFLRYVGSYMAFCLVSVWNICWN